MPTETPSEDPRWIFQNVLNIAMTRSETLHSTIDFGPQTNRALDAVARAHPDATSYEIADAYDAFEREHPPQLTEG